MPIYSIFRCANAECQVDLFVMQSTTAYFQRGKCPRCGVAVERCRWAEGDVEFQKALSELAATSRPAS